MSRVGSTLQKDAQAWLRIRVLVDFGGRFLRAKRKPEPPQSGTRVRSQACAGGWMELGTLIGAGAGSVLRYKKEPLFPTHPRKQRFSYLCVIIQFDDKLSHCAYSFSQTGYFSGSGILVIYALGSSLIDFACSSKKCSLCSSLVTSSNCSLYLLNESFHFGSDCFVSSSSCLCYYDSFLCRFDVSQSVHLHIILKNYLCLFCIKAWTRTVQCKHTITF